MHSLMYLNFLSLIHKEALLKPLAINKVSETVCQVLERGLVQLQIRRGSRVGGEEDPKPPDESLTRRRLAAEVSHDTRDDHLLHTHLAQLLLQARVPERAVRVLPHHHVLRQPLQLRHELRLRCPVHDEVAVPPLRKHAAVTVSVGVAREDDGDGGSSAELNGLEQVGEDWVGHGGKVVLHVNDQEC